MHHLEHPAGRSGEYRRLDQTIYDHTGKSLDANVKEWRCLGDSWTDIGANIVELLGQQWTYSHTTLARWFPHYTDTAIRTIRKALIAARDAS